MRLRLQPRKRMLMPKKHIESRQTSTTIRTIVFPRGTKLLRQKHHHGTLLSKFLIVGSCYELHTVVGDVVGKPWRATGGQSCECGT